MPGAHSTGKAGKGRRPGEHAGARSTDPPAWKGAARRPVTVDPNVVAPEPRPSDRHCCQGGGYRPGSRGRLGGRRSVRRRPGFFGAAGVTARLRPCGGLCPLWRPLSSSTRSSVRSMPRAMTARDAGLVILASACHSKNVQGERKQRAGHLRQRIETRNDRRHTRSTGEVISMSANAVISRPARSGSATTTEAHRGELHDFTCADCGYGICLSRLPERCPMCHGSAWRAPNTFNRTASSPDHVTVASTV